MIARGLLTGLLLTVAGCGDPQSKITPFPEAPPKQLATPGRPNILLILVDDLGFTDLGITGGEILTPNIDALAHESILLTGLRAMPTCTPSRAALLTGVDPHRAGLGTMAHGAQSVQRNQPGYEGYLNDRVVTVPQLLADAGYRTYMVGKWDLGMAAGQTPDARGFERSWSLLNGGASHFADAAGLIIFERKATYMEDGVEVKPPTDFFSSTFYTDRMIDYLQQGRDEQRPFFAYVAYTAPHWPLQAPDDYLQRQRGRYSTGYEVLRQRRIARMRELGLFPQRASAAQVADFVPAWTALSPEEQQRSARSMEIYAAMVEQLDVQIGRLLDYLRASKQYRNTLVVITSDNGPEGNDIGKLPLNNVWLPMAFDNSLENMGRRDSYVWYGSGWASASAGPYALYKAFTAEGGVRVPMVLKMPAGHVATAQRDQAFSMMDLAATLLDAAGVPHPGERYRGKTVLPMTGHSLWPVWTGAIAPAESAPLVMELFGRRMVLDWPYKALYFPPPYGSGAWRLFDLRSDPGETADIATQRPEVMARMQVLWQTFVTDNAVILPDGDGAYDVPQSPGNG